MRRGRPTYADELAAARQRSHAFFDEMPPTRATTNAASRLSAVLGSRSSRSRDPSPASTRTHTVAFGRTVQSTPTMSPHGTPRATPKGSPRKPPPNWIASKEYLARIRLREKEVHRDGDASDGSGSDEDLYELSEDSLDEQTFGATTRQSKSRNQSRGRSHGRSKSPSRGARDIVDPESPKSARRKVSFVPRYESESIGDLVPPPEPRLRAECVLPTPAPGSYFPGTTVPSTNQGTTTASSTFPGTTRSPAVTQTVAKQNSLRHRLPKKPELATPVAVPKPTQKEEELLVDEELLILDPELVASDSPRLPPAHTRKNDKNDVENDDLSPSSSDVSSLDPNELTTPPPDPTRISSRVAAAVAENVDGFGFDQDVCAFGNENVCTFENENPRSDDHENPRSDNSSPTGGLVTGIARRSSGALLDSVTPTVDSVVDTTGGSIVSFGDAGDASAERKHVTKYRARSPCRSPSRSPGRSPNRDFRNRHQPQRQGPVSTPGSLAGSPVVWVPPGVASRVSPQSLQKKFASDLFASPLYAKSPHSPSSALSSASTSAAKATAFAAQRRCAFANAVMGDAVRFQGDDGLVAFAVDAFGWRPCSETLKEIEEGGGSDESDTEVDFVSYKASTREAQGEQEQRETRASQASLVSELRAVAKALGEEVSAAAAREAARKLQTAAARADAKMASLSEEHRLKHVRRENAFARRATCRLLRHRLRQWRISASKSKLVRAVGKKWRWYAKRNAKRKDFEGRRADAFYSQNLLARAKTFLLNWRSHCAESLGMAQLAELAVIGAARRRMRSAVDTWRYVTKVNVAAFKKSQDGDRKAAQYSRVRRFRYVTDSFVVWRKQVLQIKDGRATVLRMQRAMRMLTLGRVLHSWFGVSRRKSADAEAVLQECLAEAQLRKALRKMANTNDKQNRIRRWYLRVRERHLTALGHWAGSVAKRSLVSWRALAYAGRRDRARRRTANALKKIVDAQNDERDVVTWRDDLESKRFYGDFFQEFEFETPSPLRGDGSDSSAEARDVLFGAAYAYRRGDGNVNGTYGASVRAEYDTQRSTTSVKDGTTQPQHGAPRALRDVNGRLATSLCQLKNRKTGDKNRTRKVGTSRLAKDALSLSHATDTTVTYAMDPTTPKRMARQVGAVSKHHTSAMKPSGAKIQSGFNDVASPNVSRDAFANAKTVYASPAALRARSWETPELEQSLKKLAPAVWRTAFEEAKEGVAFDGDCLPVQDEEDDDFEEEDDDSAERLLEMARRHRRVAWH